MDIEKFSILIVGIVLILLLSLPIVSGYVGGQKQIQLEKEKTEQMKIQLERDKLGLPKLEG